MKKYTLSLCLVFLVIFPAVWPIFPFNVLAAQGKIYIAMSKTDIVVGDTIEVTVNAVDDGNNRISAAMNIEYDMELFSFISCSASSYQGGERGSLTAAGSTVTVTLKAVKSGSGGISVSGSNTASSESITGASAAVSVSGTAEDSSASAPDSSDDTTPPEDPDKSSDNSLSQLNISHGTLSPEFEPAVRQYTVNVGPDVNEINIEAKTSNRNASIESIKGNENLKPGENTINIDVRAEDGQAAVYTIVVIKGGTENNQQPEEQGAGETDGTSDQALGNDSQDIVIDGINYKVASDFSSEEIPEDFQETGINYRGQEVKAARFHNGYITLLYLTSDDENGKNGLYVYHETQNIFQPYLKLPLADKYIIILYPSNSTAVPDGYSQTELEVSGQGGVIGYQLDEAGSTRLEDSEKKVTGGLVSGVAFSNLPASVEATDNAGADNRFGEPMAVDSTDFYLLYAMNSDGAEGWYQYDAGDGTIQRYLQTGGLNDTNDQKLREIQKAMNDLDKKHKEEKAAMRKWYIVFIILIVLLIFTIVNLILFSKKRTKNDYYDGDPKEESIFNLKTIIKEKRREEEYNFSEKEEEIQETKEIPQIFSESPKEEAKLRKTDHSAMEADHKENQKEPNQEEWIKDYEIKVPKVSAGGNELEIKVPKVSAGGNELEIKVPKASAGGNELEIKVPKVSAGENDLEILDLNDL